MLRLTLRLVDHYQIGVEFIAAVQALGTISVAHWSWSVFLDAMLSIRLADHYQINIESIATVRASGTNSVAHWSWLVFLDATLNS